MKKILVFGSVTILILSTALSAWAERGSGRGAENPSECTTSVCTQK